MAARSPLMTYPVAVKLHPGLSDLQQVGVSSVQRAAFAAHGRPGTTQRDPHWPRMDKLFLAVVVSGLLVLVAAAGLFTLARDTAVEAPAYAVRQRH